MTLTQFLETLDATEPPVDAAPPLRALWFEKQNRWHDAHAEVQDSQDSDSAWVHAYLHRKEGDVGNAAYWYRIAGKGVCQLSSEEEWNELVEAFLSR